MANELRLDRITIVRKKNDPQDTLAYFPFPLSDFCLNVTAIRKSTEGDNTDLPTANLIGLLIAPTTEGAGMQFYYKYYDRSKDKQTDADKDTIKGQGILRFGTPEAPIVWVLGDLKRFDPTALPAGLKKRGVLAVYQTVLGECEIQGLCRFPTWKGADDYCDVYCHNPPPEMKPHCDILCAGR
ncbi:MAG: hypothetical protein HZC40_17210 [Chloroflexi bacterium]|nr:hypothetical protein [Chloroflexota bacterium]